MSFKKNQSTSLLLAGCFALLLTAFIPRSSAIQYTSGNNLLRDTVPGNDTMIGDKIFQKVEVEAYFPGGESAWRSYLEKNLNPLIPINNGAPEGVYTVTVQFVVDVNGKLSAIEALTKHGFGMEQEVMRIIRKSPPWVPAVQDGRKVRAYRKQPVIFQVIVEKKKKRRS